MTTITRNNGRPDGHPVTQYTVEVDGKLACHADFASAAEAFAAHARPLTASERSKLERDYATVEAETTMPVGMSQSRIKEILRRKGGAM